MKTRTHHIDITDPSEPVIQISDRDRLMIQTEMIIDHQFLDAFPDIEAAAWDWVEAGYAKQFGEHYKPIEK